jgi:hypothetical protein
MEEGWTLPSVGLAVVPRDVPVTIHGDTREVWLDCDGRYRFGWTQPGQAGTVPVAGPAERPDVERNAP